MKLPKRLADYQEKDGSKLLPNSLREYQEQSENVSNPDYQTGPAGGEWAHGPTTAPEPLSLDELPNTFLLQQPPVRGNMDESVIEEIGPTPSLAEPETPLKRGPGRPRKDPNAPVKHRAPYGSRSSRRSLEQQIGGTLALLNFAFAFLPEPWSGDALSDVEIVALAKSLNDAAQQNPTMHKYLSSVMVEGGAMANLLVTVGVIVGSRMARHGMLPNEFDARLQTLLAQKVGLEKPE